MTRPRQAAGFPPFRGSETSYAGRVALVTGASRGIGASVARAFVSAGARVVLAARDADALARLRADLDPDGGSVLDVVTDVADPGAVRAAVAAAVDTFGRLDVAVNSAAAHGSRPTRLAELDLDVFDRTIAVSLRGVFVSMQAEIQAMLAGGGGAIVNIASTAGERAVQGLADYVAAKHGVVGLTRTAALDYAGQDVRVNALLPGPIHTEQLDRAGEQARARVAGAVPAGRLGAPREVAAATLWLCGPAAAFVTGATLAVDGGLLAGAQTFEK